MLTVTTNKSIWAYKKQGRKFRASQFSIRVCTHRLQETSTSIRGFTSLYYLHGSVLKVTREISTGRIFSRGLGQSLLKWLVLQILSSPQVTYQPRNAARVISISGLIEVLRHGDTTHNSISFGHKQPNERFRR
ncbi:hypothetical protein NPIL_395821 [Nephila pilipes]|uniref:Uncharacterized protein n=1 Tax=Nephila pilipes TaxID=299642 RepID=A0A8X6PVW3_NEPPI|nr:hypothetical protein NPIL_395821 [Nephila pilipes]